MKQNRVFLTLMLFCAVVSHSWGENHASKENVSIEGNLLMLDDTTPHVAVLVQVVEGDKVVDSTLSDEQGKYRFVNLKLERYQVRCRIPGGDVYPLSLDGRPPPSPPVGEGMGVRGGEGVLHVQRAITQQFNPYIAGRVVGSDLFYGRSDILIDIERTLHNNCFLLYGERRIGKTSLQHQLKERLQKADDPTYKFIPAYIDLQGVAEDDFFRTIAASIVEHAASLFKSSNGQAARSTLGLRLDEAREGYTYRDLNRDLRTVIDHLKEGETKAIKLVLLMDEVDTLNTYSLRTNLNLRGLFMGPLKENLVLVMSGLYLKMDWSAEGGGSPPFNFLSREIQIQPLDEESARKLVTEPVKGFYTYEPRAVDRIIELSELRPFTIQGFCLRAVNRVLQDGRTKITLDDIEAIKDSVLAEVASMVSTSSTRRISLG